MKEKQRCQSCAFYMRVELDDTEGWCARFPPVYTGDHYGGTPAFNYPTTTDHLWCGEWKKRDEP